MALSNQQLEDRILAIETALNDVQTALNNVATKRMTKALTAVRQTEIEELKQRVGDLETQIAVLQDDT